MQTEHDILKTTPIQDLIPTMIEGVVSPPEGVRLPWWPKFTNALGGLRPNEITLLCAPTGAGKTLFLANVSAQLCADQVSHYVAPIETGDTDFAARLFSVLTKYNFNNGAAHPIERVKSEFEKQAELLKHSKAFISKLDNRVSVEDMIATLTFYSNRHGIKVALLDNLNFFLKITSAQNERIEMDSAIHEFVMAAKRLPIHIILVVHPRKTDGGRIESEFDIKGSSTAVQECANVALFNRPRSVDIENKTSHPTDREFVFKKIRKRGEFVNQLIKFGYVNGRLMEEK